MYTQLFAQCWSDIYKDMHQKIVLEMIRPVPEIDVAQNPVGDSAKSIYTCTDD